MYAKKNPWIALSHLSTEDFCRDVEEFIFLLLSWEQFN